MAAIPRRGIVVVLAAVGWTAFVVGPPLALARWRDRRLAELSSPAVQAEWDRFRDDMRRESGSAGPVQRKVPKSPQPPELVWLRDRFGLAVTAWVVLAGVPGAFLGWLAVGLARRPFPAAAGPSAAEQQPGSQRHDEEQHGRDRQHADEREHP